MASLSACDEAASVVTVLKAGRAAGAKALRLSGEAMFLLSVLDSMVKLTGGSRKEGEMDGDRGEVAEDVGSARSETIWC